MGIVLYIIILVLIIILDYYIAKQFESVAEDKGYAERKYFHLCFWLGVVGYLLVIALPDRGQKYIGNTNASTPQPTVTANGIWTCGNCKTENSINYGQCKKCGKFRSN